ncbi:MAG TPA: PKD domain-containing protein, partial [Actinomycetota bacterium]
GDGIPTWSFSGGTGTCTADNVHLPAASVTCTDDGGYTATWTIDDQLNPAVSDTASLTVLNVPPTPTLSLSAGPYPLAQAVSASTAIADPGADTHTCSIDWGDGATTSGCGGAHTYAAGGTYTVTVTATDDDGGVGTDAKSLTVDAPPTVGAGGDRSGLEGALVALGGSVADDGAAASTWSAAAGAGVDPGASCSFTNAASPATSASCTDDGTWTLTLRADDGVNPPVSDTLTLTLGNADPTIAITSPPAGASPLAVSFSAAVADPGANDVLTCTIAWGDGSSSAGTVSGGVCTATHAYAAGTVGATLTATVADDDGGSASASRSLTFNRPPVCAGVDSSLDTLWPPNHAMRLIVLGGATDPDGDALTYAITSVRQDEPLNSGGDGDTSPDALLGANGALWLRAERSGTGDGRVYTIAFSVSDGNASCTGSVRVSVPHSAKKAAVLTPGPGYDSLG